MYTKFLFFSVFIFLLNFHLQAQRHQSRQLEHIFEEKFRGISEGLEKSTPNAFRSLGEQKLTNITNNSESEGEIFIAVNPMDSNNLVLSFMYTAAFGGLEFPIYYTLDAGDTWTASTFNPADVWAQDTSLFIAGGGDPVLAFDDQGTLYFSWLYAGVNLQAPSDFVFVMSWASSTDKGQSFQVTPGKGHFIGRGALDLTDTTGFAVTNFDDGVFDRQWMGVDRSGGAYNGSLYAAMLFLPNDSTDLAGNGIVCKYKRANDSSFQRFHAPVSAPNHLVVQFANVVVDGSGNVHVSYVNLDTTTSSAAGELYHTISTDGGQSFGAPTKIADLMYYEAEREIDWDVHNRENPAPNMVVNPTNDQLYISWTSFDSVGPRTIARGYFATSTDMGQTWSTPVEVTSLLDPNLVRHALMPTVAVNELNELSIGWFSLDTAQAEGHFYMASSEDGGQNFGVPEQLTTEVTNFSQYNNAASQPFFGDYCNAVRTEKYSFFVWSDGRNNDGAKAYIGKVKHRENASLFELTPLGGGVELKKLFPNPASDFVSLELELKRASQVSVQLFTVDGKQLDHNPIQQLSAGTHTLQVPVSQLASGNYLLVIETDFGFITRRIMVG